jgi:hypothetical protein
MGILVVYTPTEIWYLLGISLHKIASEELQKFALLVIFYNNTYLRWNLCTKYDTPFQMVQGLRLDLSKRADRLGVSLPLPEDGIRSSFPNVVF